MEDLVKAEVSRFEADLESGGPSRYEQAVHDLFVLCESDPVLRRVLDKHRAGRDQLQEIFELLLNAGAGQWVSGHYVAASTLAFAATLDFVLTNAGQLSWQKMCVLLLEYFERGDMGPVPLDVRGPANPNDPLTRIWELEQKAKNKR